MVCLNPQFGYRSANGGFTSAPGLAVSDEQVVVACNYCDSCLERRCQDWTTRAWLEFKDQEHKYFLTQTYRDEDYPGHGSLDVGDMQGFLKRWRDHEVRRARKEERAPGRLRFLGCGEYGSRTGRAHFHLNCAGVELRDLAPYDLSGSGEPLYTSPLLEDLWGKGFVKVGSLSRRTLRYTVGYTFKKRDSGRVSEPYLRAHALTGEPVVVRREFLICSRRPGIGSAWFDEYESDCFPSDFIVIDGERVPVPRSFSEKLRGRYRNPGSVVGDPERDDLAPIRAKRIARAESPQQLAENEPERVAVRQESLELRIRRRERGL